MTAPPPDDDAGDSSSLTWGVGAVAQRLGVAASTLRTWERRYDIGPSFRTSGGHRRYTTHDIERVDVMRRLLDRGVTPREAARSAHDLDPAELTALVAGEEPGDNELTREAFVAEVIAAVQVIDPDRLSGLFSGALRRHGVLAAWPELLSPALIAIGEGWANGRIDIVGEHIASERLSAELRLHTRSFAAAPVGHSAVVLASAEEDQHSLPVYALESALAEQGLGSLMLGARVPWESLSGLARRTNPEVIFVWATLERRFDDALMKTITELPEQTRLVLGGPGWGSLSLPRAQRVGDLTEAVNTIAGRE